MTVILSAAAAIVFVGHAANYGYFFMDDEGIPFVTAQNVVAGRGFVYNPADGHVEAYSDFLHVWIDTATLAAVRGVGADKIAVFFVGKFISLAFGVGVVWLVLGMLRRLNLSTGPPMVAGAGFIVLAGPLAVWSMSSLEATEFAFFVALLAYALCDDSSRRRSDWLAALAVAAVVLDRIDGFIFAASILLGMWVCAPANRRRNLARRVIAPGAIVFGAYHAWRLFYYRDLLPPAVTSKILFKFMRGHVLVTRPEPQAYAIRFFDLFSWLPPVVSAAALGTSWRHERRVMGLALSAAALSVYVSLVEDWMFGYRFFVALLPVFAILTGWTVARLQTWRSSAGWTAAAIGIAACLMAAVRFEASFEHEMERPSWLVRPRLGLESYFPASYYNLQKRLRDLAGPGDTMETNLAGFLPFMVDIPTIDNQGICTRFFAEVPTTDVVFTEVGRYSPMTPKAVLRATDAYLLYRAPTFIVEPHNWIVIANKGKTPSTIFGGRYERLPSNDDQAPDVFVRCKDIDPLPAEPNLFLENIAHVSEVASVRVNGKSIPPSAWLSQLPYLHEDEGTVTVRGSFDLDIRFDQQDVPVYELYIDRLAATAPVQVALSLQSTGGTVYHETFDVARDRPMSWLRRLPTPIPASQAVLIIAGSTTDPVSVTLSDIRVQGQRPRLARFIERTVPGHFR